MFSGHTILLCRVPRQLRSVILCNLFLGLIKIGVITICEAPLNHSENKKTKSADGVKIGDVSGANGEERKSFNMPYE